MRKVRNKGLPSCSHRAQPTAHPVLTHRLENCLAGRAHSTAGETEACIKSTGAEQGHSGLVWSEAWRPELLTLLLGSGRDPGKEGEGSKGALRLPILGAHTEPTIYGIFVTLYFRPISPFFPLELA